jgi:drug/metabolite transporter (DMT)-like permease
MEKRTTLGVIFVCAGVLVFSLQDGIVKLLSTDYSVTEAVYIRSLIAVPLLAGLVHWEVGVGALVSPRYWWLFARACVLFVSYMAYYLAFPALPLADAIALFFVAPLFIAVLAGPVLGETVGWRSWGAVAIGTAGVVVMLRPGSGFFEPAALLSLFSALLYAAAALLTRRLGETEPGSVMTFYQNIVFLAGAALTAAVLTFGGVDHANHPSLNFLVRSWQMPTTIDLALMGSCGIIATVGTLFLTQAYRIAEASRIGPFEYTGILWGPVWGFLIFSEVPRSTTIAGAALIVVSGLVALQPARKTKVSADTNTGTSELLAALHAIANDSPRPRQTHDSRHVGHLCDLGYLVALSANRYEVTREGRAILMKEFSLSAG